MLLKENGDFVVRTDPKLVEQRSYVLSVLADKLLDENSSVWKID
ncbi:Protein CBG26502 [Caenorhabditis briggsae]|uniref:Protein CBG26502 n=1 Tax=Caenorhabditis briggsae TaxID=6238 RepID=B6ILB9_CAEBR|nr:Protein CBG26502 [Caenorhabditis briggsae]CAS00699.1 Protein CBG26502 [Caenorhabditis briggsae]